MKTKPHRVAGLAAGFALLLCPRASARSITDTSSPGVVIPDNNLNGVADTINLGTSINFISDVTVTLDISGGYNGDYYAYLRHSDGGGTGFAVLLNRVGESASAPFGSSDSGFDVTFSDSAASNIHPASAGGGVLTGTFQPDGRNVSPFTSAGTLEAAPSSAFLSSFDGMDPNGAWTLFIADVSPLGIGTLEDWSLTVDGTASVGVPDGGSTFCFLGISLIAIAGFHRRPSHQ